MQPSAAVCIIQRNEKPKIVTTYNKIEIHVGNIYDGSDLWHELMHVKMLTEAGIILHPYPIGIDNLETYYTFANIITNLVYDIYVDVELYFSHEEIDREYYNRKYSLYCAFLKRQRVFQTLQEDPQCVIKELIEEYCQILIDIRNNDIIKLKKYRKSTY